MVAAIALLLLRPAPQLLVRPSRARVVLEMPQNAMYPYSRDDDAYLWKHQNELEAAAEYLGRGVSSCENRLERLRNPKTDGYRRLFGSDDEEEADAGGLRCVRDCIQRILHDPALDPATFRVGYSDRFRPLPREVAFDKPNDSIDGAERSFVLALPEHRIVYLKYQKRLVWHRPLRLDLIFGSRGSGSRIQDVVATYDEWARERDERISEANARAAAALGSADSLKEFKQLLKGAAQRKVEMAAFVDAALSPSVLWEGDAEALLDLVATLPDEHTELRDEMLEAIGEQLRVAARGARG